MTSINLEIQTLNRVLHSVQSGGLLQAIVEYLYLFRWFADHVTKRNGRLLGRERQTGYSLLSTVGLTKRFGFKYQLIIILI